jgi:quercetin dioxygenase-like cupin family protein
MYIEMETINTINQPRRINRYFNPSSAFDLPELIKNLKHEPSWENGDLESKILLKGPDKKILLTVLHKGTEISSFLDNESLTLQVIEGKLKVHLRNGSIALSMGESLIINENIKYSIDSLEETAFLMTLAIGN